MKEKRDPEAAELTVAVLLLCCAWNKAFMATVAEAVVPFICASYMTVLFRESKTKLLAPLQSSSSASASSALLVKSTEPKHEPCKLNCTGTMMTLACGEAKTGNPALIKA